MEKARFLLVPVLALVPALPVAAEAAPPDPAPAAVAAAIDESPWKLPTPGACNLAADASEDAPTGPELQPGTTLGYAELAELEPYLPPEIWALRDDFFFEGMQLEVGPCFRDYAPPEFFREATARFRGRAQVGEDGSLIGYKAGLAFAPASIEPDDPEAGIKWAWDSVTRYGAGGRFGNIRLTTVAGEKTGSLFRGEYFMVPIVGRSDRAEDEFRFPTKLSAIWVGGGETKNIRGDKCSWRQYGYMDRRPELAIYDPERRSVRRAFPLNNEGPVPICRTDGQEGFFFRGGFPLLYSWKFLGIRDVLAPINARTPAYPEDKNRNFGPLQVSFANDRWELRRALVVEGTVEESDPVDGADRFIWYYDLQTLTSLYYISYRKDQSLGSAGYFVGRWSEDRPDYPRWKDDPERQLRVIDTVGAAIVDKVRKNIVRLEAWDTVASPPSDRKVKRMLSQSGLRGR